MAFEDDIRQVLASGEKTLDEIKEILPANRQGAVLDYLRAGKDAGLLSYVTKKIDGKYVVVVRPGALLAGTSNPPVAQPATPTNPPQSGGGN